MKKYSAEIVQVTPEMQELADAYLQRGIVTRKDEDDALHIASATVCNADIVVSRNFKHIVHFEKIQRFNQGDASFWAMAIEYLPASDSAQPSTRNTTSKTDFKALLPPEDFALFARLREWRKQIANAEAVPVYTVFTNEQLAEMSRRRPSSLSALCEIDGIGQGRLDKYGKAVLKVIGDFRDGAGEGTVSPDN